MSSTNCSTLSNLTIVGGVYHEACIWPDWDQVFGSAGRAASALSGHVHSIHLCCYARPDIEEKLKAHAAAFGFTLKTYPATQTISFEYVHSLSAPVIRPIPALITQYPPIDVSAEVALRFGMMEGTARVSAARCVYDPQSAFDARPFHQNGSTAARLAIVGNRSEIAALGNDVDPISAAKKLLCGTAEVVIVKSGATGAFVVDANGISHVPAFLTQRVWKIGSGDVFAAVFASEWGVKQNVPAVAAEIASRAVAEYVDSMSLPIPLAENLKKKNRPPSQAAEGRIYIASPFFSMGQRWLVDEARQSLRDLGMKVFSPVHDVGPGPADTVAPADLAELGDCDAVLAILDGNDPGTIFEVGYARALQKPVYALAQTVSVEDLKMVMGSGCHIYDDFVTAVHHAAWRT